MQTETQLTIKDAQIQLTANALSVMAQRMQIFAGRDLPAKERAKLSRALEQLAEDLRTLPPF